MPDHEFHRDAMGPAHDALDRMRRAHERGTGCRLTPDMIEALGRSSIGQMWAEEDPRETETST